MELYWVISANLAEPQFGFKVAFSVSATSSYFIGTFFPLIHHFYSISLRAFMQGRCKQI